MRRHVWVGAIVCIALVLVVASVVFAASSSMTEAEMQQTLHRVAAPAKAAAAAVGIVGATTSDANAGRQLDDMLVETESRWTQWRRGLGDMAVAAGLMAGPETVDTGSLAMLDVAAATEAAVKLHRLQRPGVYTPTTASWQRPYLDSLGFNYSRALDTLRRYRRSRGQSGQDVLLVVPPVAFEDEWLALGAWREAEATAEAPAPAPEAANATTMTPKALAELRKGYMGRVPFPRTAGAHVWTEADARVLRAVEGAMPDDLVPLPQFHVVLGKRRGPEYAGNTREKMQMLSGVQLGGDGDPDRTVDVVVKLPHLVGRPVARYEMVNPVMRVARECGFGDEVLSLHLAVHAPGLSTEFATVAGVRTQGITLERFRGAGARPRYDPEVARVLSRLDHVSVRRLALMDVLFGFTDRHFANVLLGDDMRLHSIDSFQNTLSSLRGAPNSIFIPWTEKYATHRLSWAALYADKPKPPYDDPIVSVDYRCHTPGGRIGHVYPAPFRQCLRRMANMTVPELRDEYQFRTRTAAEWLVETSKSLLKNGFEETVLSMLQRKKEDSDRARKAHPERRNILVFSEPWKPCCLLLDNQCQF